MKIKLLGKIFNSTLSCIFKSLRFLNMIHKKLTFGLFVVCFLSACSSPTAMLGPAYTLTSTGSGIQAGLNYGSNHLITMYTGRTPIENLKEISTTENIQKKTLESEDFYILVKQNVEKTNKILKSFNQ